MTGETVPDSVTPDRRDQLAEEAEALRSEREATRADASSREVAREEREWEAAVGDGID